MSKTLEEMVAAHSHMEKLSSLCFLTNVFNHNEIMLDCLYRVCVHLCSPRPLARRQDTTSALI